MRFIEEQIESLLAQSYPHIIITVRDDESTDGTYQKLLNYSLKYDHFLVKRGEHLGIVKSFFELLREAKDNCAYYAFCDQDDIWLRDKIKHAVEMMSQEDASNPLLYFSRVEYVDSNLNHLEYSKVLKEVGFANALVENVATGCTIVLNKVARNLLCEQIPHGISIHDWWCYLVISGLGRIIYDERPTIKYRLHSNNAIGHTLKWHKRFEKWLFTRRIINKGVLRESDHAKEFQRCYGTKLGLYETQLLENYLKARKDILYRFWYAIVMDVWLQSRLDTFWLRIRIMAGRF